MNKKWKKDTEAISENQWNCELSKFVKIIEGAGAFWCCDTELKYLNIRVDTRDGAFIILGKDGNRIEPDRVLKAVEEWQAMYSEKKVTSDE